MRPIMIRCILSLSAGAAFAFSAHLPARASVPAGASVESAVPLRQELATDGQTAALRLGGERAGGNAAGFWSSSTDAWRPKAPMAPQNYVEQITSSPSPTQYGYYSSPVTIVGDTAFVSSPTSPGGGKVYVYTLSAGVWTLVQTLQASDGGGQFGVATAIDGNTAVIGANLANSLQGKAYVFVYASGNWTQSAILTADNGVAADLFGQSVAIKGDTLLIGAPQVDSIGNQYQGAAYIFRRSGVAWNQVAELTANDGAANNYFSFTLGLASETDAVVGGSGSSAAAWVFQTTDGIAWAQTQKLVAVGGGDNATFSFGYCLSVDGDTLVVGAENASFQGFQSNEGAAFVFKESAGTWALSQVLSADNGSSGDGFGRAVAVSGTNALIGAWGVSGYTGAAYLFKSVDGTFSQAREFFGSDSVANDYYGYNVAQSDAASLVGGYAHTVAGLPYAGEAYFYTHVTAGGAPVVGANPASFDFSIAAGNTVSALLTLSNNGGGTLDYTLGETSAADCSALADVPWLAESRNGGAILDGDEQGVQVMVDTTGLAPGSYAASVCVSSNDAVNPVVAVPVTLNVPAPNLVCSAPINHAIADDQDGTYANWLTGEVLDDAPADIYQFNAYQGGGLAFYWGDPGNAGVATTVDGSDYRVLQMGDSVGPQSVFSANYSAAPGWDAGADGYLGFRFNCDAGTCYGYTHLVSSAGGGYPATLVDYCYDSNGNTLVIGGIADAIFVDGFDGAP